MPATRWKPVVGFEELYEVSEEGVVKSLARMSSRVYASHTKALPVKERILKHWSTKGYQYVTLCNGTSLKKSVHRIVAEAFLKSDEDKPHVNHINSNPSDNRVENLEWVTMSENQTHAVEFGLRATGEKSNWSKLSNIEAEFVKLWAGMGFKQGLIADLFDITQSQVSRIFNNKQRQHQYKGLQHGDS
jgi:predicted XRE-type DNA-binding protein